MITCIQNIRVVAYSVYDKSGGNRIYNESTNDDLWTVMIRVRDMAMWELANDTG